MYFPINPPVMAPDVEEDFELPPVDESIAPEQVAAQEAAKNVPPADAPPPLVPVEEP